MKTLGVGSALSPSFADDHANNKRHGARIAAIHIFPLRSQVDELIRAKK